MKIPILTTEDRILVIGDVMLDSYLWGSVSRVSPEAPVPVVKLENSTTSCGGAANVAANIAGMGGHPVLIGCIGDDDHGKQMPELLELCNVYAGRLVVDSDRPTTVKTRILAQGQQIARVDRENSDQVTGTIEMQLLEQIARSIKDIKTVVFSDYAKGVVTDRVLKETFGLANAAGIPVIVDPKGTDYLRYAGGTVVTPNRREAAEACSLTESVSDVVNLSGTRLVEKLGSVSVLITEGEHGMTLFTKEDPPVHFEASARDVYDVTGAGDTVVAALGVATAAGFDLATACEFANNAAGVAVEHVGTTIVTTEMIHVRMEDEKTFVA